MKNALKFILHRLLGFGNYLFLFALVKIKTLKLDKKESDFFRFMALLPENTAVLDIGANIGIMSVHLSKHLKRGKVFAFEPVPYNINAFRKVIKYFGLTNVELFEFALGDENGKAEMIVPVSRAVKLQGLSHVLHSSITDYNDGDVFSVDIKRIDDLPDFSNPSLAVGGIKIDIENFEYFALKGARNLIELHKPIVYAELWENDNRSNCFRLMADLNYRVMVSDKGILTQYDVSKHKKQNFIFMPVLS